MRSKLQNNLFVFITIFALFFSSCQVEENAITNDTKSSNYNIKNISKDEIDSNSKIVEKLQKLSAQKNSATGKNITFDNLGLTIQTDHARYIEDGNYHSYTFATLQKDTENIKNVLFSLNANGEYDAYLVEYDYNKLDLAKFTNNNKPGEVKMTPIKLDINSLTSKSVALWVCKYSYELVSSGDLVGAENVTTEWVLVATSCTIVYATIIGEDNSSTNYGNGTSSNTTNGYMNPSAGGGGGSIATSPLFAFYDEPEIIKIEFVKKYLNVGGQQKRFLEANGEVAFSLYDYLVKNRISEESISFGTWALNYLMQNPDVTISQFENQFMGTSEGQDGDYDAAYWDDPNLTFQKQNLPNWKDFNSAFPKDSNPLYDTPEKMYKSIGGDVVKFYSGPKTNTCAIRLSKALNYSGVTIPDIPGKTYKGDDNKYYFKAAYQLNLWMRQTFGTNPASNTTPKTPYNANHVQYTQEQAGVHGVNLPSLLNGKKGIYSIYSSNFNWASGHADLLNSDATCGNQCHFYDAPIFRLDIWILN